MSFNSEMNMNWKIMDYKGEDARYWMDDKTKVSRCTRLNKNPTTWRVSKTCVSRHLSLLRRKETQKNTTRIRDGGRREKYAVN